MYSTSAEKIRTSLAALEDEIKSSSNKLEQAVSIRAKQILISRNNKALYDDLIKETKPRLLCIGPGGNFHDSWMTADRMYSENKSWTENHNRGSSSPPDFLWNAHDGKELPIETNSVQAIYCSHMLEHIPMKLALPFLIECIRTLSKKGVFRIITPDAALEINAFISEDWFYFLEHFCLAETTSPPALFSQYLDTYTKRRNYAAWCILNKFSLIFAPENSKNIGLTYDKCAEFVDESGGIENAIERATTLCDNEYSRQIGGHLSWWTVSRIRELLADQANITIQESRYLQSVSPFMRHRHFFDKTDPHNSLYVEIIKK